MASSYPGALDALTNPTATDTMDSVTVPHATQHANANDAIEAVQAELGTDPAGASATVKARLDTLDTTVAAKAPAASPTFTGTVTTPLTTAGYVKTSAGGVLSSSAAVPEADVTGLTAALAGKVDDALLVGYTQNAATAIDSIPRWAVSTSVAVVSASTYLMQFTAPWDLTCTQMSMSTGATASATLTLARMGLFTVSGDDYTLVVRTASDTTLFNAASTVHTRSWDTAGGYPASYSLVAGTRYALGVLVIGTTMPTLLCSPVTSLGGLYNLSPRIATFTSAQTELVNQYALTNTSTRNYWARLS